MSSLLFKYLTHVNTKQNSKMPKRLDLLLQSINISTCSLTYIKMIKN